MRKRAKERERDDKRNIRDNKRGKIESGKVLDKKREKR